MLKYFLILLPFTFPFPFLNPFSPLLLLYPTLSSPSSCSVFFSPSVFLSLILRHLPHLSIRSWRSVSAIITMQSCSLSERLTARASRRSSSSRNRSCKRCALSWRTRGKPCWVSQKPPSAVSSHSLL